MRKVFLVLTLLFLLSACRKNKCWIMSDCAGNDVGSFCGSEQEVKDQCAANSTASCTFTYRKQ